MKASTAPVSRAEPLLSVRSLSIAFPGPSGPVRVVDDISFDIARTEKLAMVGESGSGKSVTALAILGLLRGARTSGQVFFEGEDLLRMGSRRLRQIRGSRISLIFQDPLSSLNPVMTVGDQISEALVVRGEHRRHADRRAAELLERVGIANSRRRLQDYPHQFSGGMRQRVMIAIALVSDPELLIADEPTTALDVRVQAQVMDLLRELANDRRMAVMLITHDLGVVAGFADRVCVMYSGRAVETCSTRKLFYAATHPYTWGLIGSVPRADAPVGGRLVPIDGQPPEPGRRPGGCPFHPRCPYVQSVCRSEPPGLTVHPGDDHDSACHFAGQLRRPAYMPEPLRSVQ